MGSDSDLVTSGTRFALNTMSMTVQMNSGWSTPTHKGDSPGGRLRALHGISPVWSPTGNQIVYMRQCATYQPTEGAGLRGCTEQHEVVLVTPEGDEVVLPNLQLPDGDHDNPFWFVSRVSWSPDGSQLLYRAQAGGDDALIAVPLDPRSAPVMLHEGGIAGYAEGYLLASRLVPTSRADPNSYDHGTRSNGNRMGG